MPKIQDIGIGKYIRNPKGRKFENSKGSSVEILQIASSQGNSFTCFPVTSTKVGADGKEAILDKTRYLQIPVDTQVEQVTI